MNTAQSNQRTDDWHEARLGRFTGSQIHRLLGKKGLGETGKTYAFENAVEIVFGKDEEESFESFDMRRGNLLEPLAFKLFKEMKSMDFLDVQECSFFPLGDNAGASPDGLVGKDAVLEVKCPRPNKFFKLVSSGWVAIDDEYIAQMQMEMLCTNSLRCYFFNYIIFNGIPMWHEIIIERDEAIIGLIKTRIAEATEFRDVFVESLKQNKQF
jgi:YqaJ-like viral recombinase domain